MAFKVTAFINGTRNGWSETHWWAGTTTFADCEADARRLFSARLDFLAKDFTIDGIRISTPAAPRQAQLITNGEGIGRGEAALQAQNNPYTALVFRFQDTNYLYSANFLLRGCSFTNWNWRFDAPQGGVFPNAINNQLARYFNHLTNGAYTGTVNFNTGVWFINARARDGATTERVTIKDITVTPDTGGYYYLTLAAPRTWKKGTKVHIHGVRGEGLNGINGDTQVYQVVDGTHLRVTKKSIYYWSAAIVYSTLGTIELVTPVATGTPAITVVNFMRYAKRDTGRPFFGTRGRRPKRQC